MHSRRHSVTRSAASHLLLAFQASKRDNLPLSPARWYRVYGQAKADLQVHRAHFEASSSYAPSGWGLAVTHRHGVEYVVVADKAGYMKIIAQRGQEIVVGEHACACCCNTVTGSATAVVHALHDRNSKLFRRQLLLCTMLPVVMRMMPLSSECIHGYVTSLGVCACVQ